MNKGGVWEEGYAKRESQADLESRGCLVKLLFYQTAPARLFLARIPDSPESPCHYLSLDEVAVLRNHCPFFW